MTTIGGKEELSAAVAAGKPIPHVLFAVKAFGPPGVMLMMLMSFVASITCFNAGLLTASRFLYALARDNAAPKPLARIHEKYMTPHVAIWTLFVVCAALSVAVAYTGIVKPFIYMGAFAECLIYVTMAAALIKLRRTQPDQARPFRVRTMLVPYFVAGFFSIIGVGLLTQSPTAAISMGVGTVLIYAYVVGVVPRLRAKAASVAATRAPRRPKPPGSKD